MSEKIEHEKWLDYDDYIKTNNYELNENIKKSVDASRHYKNDMTELGLKPKKIDDESLYKASETLSVGNVTATDGITNSYLLLSGLQYRIGITSTTYNNNTIHKILQVSQSETDDTDSLADHLEQISPEPSSLFLKSLMFYKEREIALDAKADWKFIDGPIVPLEIRTPGLDRDNKHFHRCIDLAKKLTLNKKCIGVQSIPIHYKLPSLGATLERNEYVEYKTVGEMAQKGIEQGKRSSSKDDLDKLRIDFLDRIKVGIFRVGPKPYIFEAHEDNFDEAVALIIRDSLYQPLRGFPILIDYAHSVCGKHFSQQEFNRIIESKLAKHGGLDGFYHVPERRLRRG